MSQYNTITSDGIKYSHGEDHDWNENHRIISHGKDHTLNDNHKIIHYGENHNLNENHKIIHHGENYKSIHHSEKYGSIHHSNNEKHDIRVTHGEDHHQHEESPNRKIVYVGENEG